MELLIPRPPLVVLQGTFWGKVQATCRLTMCVTGARRQQL